MAGVSSQGTTFTFAGGSFAVTSVSVDYGQERGRVSAPHMGLGPNDTEQVFYLHKTVDSLPTVSVEFITASTMPKANDSGTLQVTGKISFSGPATCTSSQLTAAFGDLVRGTASFRVQV